MSPAWFGYGECASGDSNLSKLSMQFLLWYYEHMTPNLNQEVIDALHASDQGEVQVIDPTTNKVYFVIDSERHQQAMLALRQQQDRDAISRGLKQIETGQHKDLDQAFEDVKQRLGFSTK